MRTINLKEFTKKYMEISNNLTHAEIQILYLLITEKDVINLSQQMFANKVGTHRRTINIGFKKLLKYKYVSDINITHIQNSDGDKYITQGQVNSDGDKNIAQSQVLIDDDKNITPNLNDAGDINITAIKIEGSDINITQTAEEKAKRFVLHEVDRFYFKPDKTKKLYVGENFYHNILKETELPKGYIVNRKFITKTIQENYPECIFYWQKKYIRNY